MGPRNGQHWFRVGSIDVTTSVLISGLSALSLLIFAIEPNWLSPFWLDSRLVLHGQIWRLLTWPLVNFPTDGLWIAVAIFFFWWFGNALESLLGRVKYLYFTLLLTIVPALLITFIAGFASQLFLQPGSGIYQLETAVVIAYVAAYPGAKTFFEIPFWVLAVVLIGVNALALLGLRAWMFLIFLALEVIFGLLAARSFGISKLQWIPRIPLPAFITGDHAAKEEKTRKRAAHLHVVSEQDINALLDKIAAHGIDSLTREERRRLDEHSRERRGN